MWFTLWCKLTSSDFIHRLVTEHWTWLRLAADQPLTTRFYLCSSPRIERSLSDQALCSFSREPMANKCSDIALYIRATVICGAHITFSVSLTRLIKANEDAMLIQSWGFRREVFVLQSISSERQVTFSTENISHLKSLFIASEQGFHGNTAFCQQLPNK